MIVAQLQSVGPVLDEYIGIHNDLFGGGVLGSLRRRIPIPGFFYAIDFESHASRLATLCTVLEGVRGEIDNDDPPPQLAKPFAEYTDALLDTVRKLYRICNELAKRTKDRDAYTKAQYDSDVRQYEKSVTEYRALGVLLNRAVRAPLS